MPTTTSPATKCAVAIKPVMWSLNGYQGPSGAPVSGGFVREHGFGGEEWNGRADRVWKGHRVFHTESKPKLDLYADHANLALVMIAMHHDVQYVVGVACAVERNRDADHAAMMKRAPFKDTVKELWNTPSVKQRYENLSALRGAFPHGFDTPKWRSPTHLYQWFSKPIQLGRDPLGLGRLVLAKMHNNFQAIRPEHALTLLDDHLSDESPIRQWLIDKEFDEAFLSAEIRKKPGQSPGKRGQNFGAPAAKDPYLRYIEARVIRITPEHHRLEEAFAAFLPSISATAIKRNSSAVDVRFQCPGRGNVIAELKPAVAGQTQYPIRFAIGQVLEYRHFQNPEAHPLIVLGAKPTDGQIAFCHANKVSIGWKAGSTFQMRWYA